ncbi:MAG TPA: alkaline phosphatase family protein, partial [Polyangia bacterium]
RWCTAPTGSAPACSDGPGCCERAPDSDPAGHAPVVLDDSANGSYDPNHQSACEADEIDGGKMDRFVDSTVCGDARNVAYADAATAQPYWDLAAGGALADRWFQPVIGASASNDMFLFGAAFVFADNDVAPAAAGEECSFIPGTPVAFDDASTIGRLLATGGVSWSFYAEGYAAMLNAEQGGGCPEPPDDCAAGIKLYPCIFDPSDLPAEYYGKIADANGVPQKLQFADQPPYVRDYQSFVTDLGAGSLSQVAFVKGAGYHSEHPGLRTNISDGIRFVQSVIDAVAKSDYAPDTLILVVYDEGGGFFDHVAPPAAVDAHPYGTRVPAIAVGPLARKGSVSHVTMEHSSIVKFVEWNWLAGTGQLGARDGVVSNIGSLVDPAVGVPE